MTDVKRPQLLSGFVSTVAGFLAIPGFAGAQTGKPEKILVLGGTGFTGPHIVRNALERGHEVTLFNRGRTSTGLSPGLRFKRVVDTVLNALTWKERQLMKPFRAYLWNQKRVPA